MGGTPREVRDDAQGSVAAAFHVGGGGLPQERQVAGEPLGVVALDAPQAVEMGGDLLVVVEDPGDVGAQRGLADRTEDGTNLARERERSSAATEHVDRPASPQDRGPVALLKTTGDVIGDGNRVEVPSENHALAEAEPGPRAHGVTVTQNLQGGSRSKSGTAQGRLDGISQGPFVSRHRGNVDHLVRELDRVRQVRQLHDSSFVDASRIAAHSPTCVPPPFPGSKPRPRS